MWWFDARPDAGGSSMDASIGARARATSESTHSDVYGRIAEVKLRPRLKIRNTFKRKRRDKAETGEHAEIRREEIHRGTRTGRMR